MTSYIRKLETRRLCTYLLLATLVSVAAMSVARAATGDLDPSFGTDGWALTDFGFNQNDDQGVTAQAMVAQPDGKVVVVGGTNLLEYRVGMLQSADNMVAVARFDSEGSLDATFEGDGRQLIEFDDSPSGDRAFDVALQADGKIVLAGSSRAPLGSSGHERLALARLHPDGSLDGTFGQGGVVVDDFSGAGTVPEAQRLAIQPDGKIVVLGYSGSGFGIARYLASGVRDSAFGADGVTTSAALTIASDAAVQRLASGEMRILVVGTVCTVPPDSVQDCDYGLVRYLPDGTLDSTFGSSGVVVTDAGTRDDYLSTVELLPDGRILVAGTVWAYQSDPDLSLALYGADGVLVSAFGSSGHVTTDLGGDERDSEERADIVIDNIGRILVGTTSRQIIAGVPALPDLAVVRYHADGELDTSFGSGGYSLTGFPDIRDFARGIAVQADGRILVAADTHSGYVHSFAVARLDAANDQGPTVSSQGPYSVEEGASVLLQASGTDPDSASLDYAWDLNNDGVFETAGREVVFAATGLDGPSTHAIAVRVTDDTGLWAVDATEVTVSNLPPVVGAPTILTSDTVQVGATVSAEVAFSDPGSVDVHSATWDWGDGSTSPGAVSQAANSASGSHEYTSVGVFTVAVTVSDDDGGNADATYEFIVVYDPAAGSVRGNGKIASPVGACTLTTACEDARGDATFGFASKYRAGKNTPDGRTRFVFRAGDLTFVADKDQFEWLIVSGHRARFKGAGQINHGGDYGFMLTGLDADLTNPTDDEDTFRIRIWDKATDVVVYDNQRGDADDGDATTALIRGEIKIVK